MFNKKIGVVNFFVFFLILLNTDLSYANMDSYCNNKIPKNLLFKIDENLPQLIEIRVNKGRKWQKNSLKIIKDHNNIINKEYKKKFKAKLYLKFNSEVECEFKAKIRQNGDHKDHIKFIDGKFFQSLDVDLKDGHINGITQFKLLIPETRKNPDDEIIITELLREFGFLAPRTSLIKVNFNNVTQTMLLQEKAEKEFLEYHNRREGPILEGDERYMFGFKGEFFSGNLAERAQLSKQTNAKWASKGKQHENISHKAVTLLNQVYLNYVNQYTNKKESNFQPYNLDSNLLALNNLKQISDLNIYNAIILGANGFHGLRPHNRKFYWNSISNYFEPIYYDGLLDIDYQRRKSDLSSIHNTCCKIINRSFLRGLKEAKKEINKIKIEDFHNKVKSRGLTLNKNDLKDKLEKIISNLNNIESYNNKKNKIQKKSNSLNEASWRNYIDNTLKISSNINLIFRNSKDNFFLSCSNLKLECIKTYLEKNDIEELLKGRLTLNNNTYQYIGEYDVANEYLNFKELNKVWPSKYKKINFKNTKFYYDKDITFKFDEENLIFNIYQNSPKARAYFFGENLNDIHINLFGPKNGDDTIYNNYTFDQYGLTGCLSFVNINLKNISINASDSGCEDSINLINASGHIRNIKIYNAKSDALDIDFSNIKIDEIYVNNAINDCVDLSSGKYEFGKLDLSKCNDKALSVGEKSTLTLSNLLVSDTNIGISSKDSSITSVDNAYIKGTEVCFEVKRKKQEFSGGVININNYDCNGSKITKDLGSFINYQ